MTEQGSTESEPTDGTVDADATGSERDDASVDAGDRVEEPVEESDGESPASVAANGAAAGDSTAEAGDAVDEQLVERIEDADPTTIAREIAALRVEIDGLEAKLTEKEETIDDLESKLARARADFQNYKKRSEKRRAQEAERAKADLVDRLLGVHDNLQRALDQDEDVDIRGGIESTLQQFDDVLAAEDVSPIDPAAGEAVDPHRHEVLVRVDSDQPEGRIDDVHRVGYEMGDTIVREAQVTVSDGSGATGDDAAQETADDADADEGTAEDTPSSE